jgi:hypothetical protein
LEEGKLLDETIEEVRKKGGGFLLKALSNPLGAGLLILASGGMPTHCQLSFPSVLRSLAMQGCCDL